MTPVPGQYTVTGADGVRLATEVVGEGPPAVLCHGLTGTRHQILDLIGPVAAAFTVVAYDARGHGESSLPPGAPLTWDALVADLDAVMEHFGLSGCVVGGASMGAATTLRYAARRPDKVGRLLQLLPALTWGRNILLERLFALQATIVERYGIDDLIEITLSDPMLARMEVVRPGIAAEIKRDMHAHDPANLPRLLREIPADPLFETRDEYRGALGSLEMPVCVLAFPEDPVHPIKIARDYAEHIPDVTFCDPGDDLDAALADLTWVFETVGSFLAPALTG